MRVWKCDSNWGGRAILDLFVEYRCVFFGTADIKQRVGHYREVQVGDLMALSRGTAMVAVARVTSGFKPLRELSRVCVPRSIRDDFDESGAEPWGCKIEDVCWLPRPVYNGKRMMRFFELGTGREEILAYWKEHLENPKPVEFEIKSRSVHLASGESPLFDGNRNHYTVPVYQRPYAWGESQIVRLLEDIWEGYTANEGKFIGTIQLSSAVKLSEFFYGYQIIDGQQRLTTLLIVLKYLGKDLTANFRTVVNRGSAQHDWDEYIRADMSKAPSNTLNPYLNARQIVSHWLDDAFSNCAPELTPRGLCSYILDRLTFVVIETQAGVSKTLQIFNVINTAGMDLSAVDLFKLKFYEHLSPDGTNEDIFNRIAHCYQRVDDRNREVGHAVVSMQDVLSIYQRLLIAKHKLSVETYLLSNEQFFERLFDYLINNKKWPGFQGVNGVGLLLEDFEHLVDVVLKIDSLTRGNEHLRIVRRFLWETRYGWYACHMLAIACFFNVVPIEDKTECVSFVEDLLRKLVPASIAFSRVVNHIRTTRLYNLLVAMGQSKKTEVGRLLHEDWDANGMNEKTMIDTGLNQVIAWTPTWKNLICRLVEYMLARRSQTYDASLYYRLFELSFDIEHIQSFTDQVDCDQVRDLWKEELNSLGNLVMLEYEKNRSIHNECFGQKLQAYKDSKFWSVADAVRGKDEWTKDCATARRKQKAQELTQYLRQEDWQPVTIDK